MNDLLNLKWQTPTNTTGLSFIIHPTRLSSKYHLLSLLPKYNVPQSQHSTTTCPTGVPYPKQRPISKYNWSKATENVCSCFFLQLLPDYQVKRRGFKIISASEVFKLYCLIIQCKVQRLQALNETFYFFILYFHCRNIDFWHKEDKQPQPWWNTPTVCNFHRQSALLSSKLE